MSSSQLTNSILFQRGRSIPPASVRWVRFLGGLGLRFTPAQNFTFSLGMAYSGYPKLLGIFPNGFRIIHSNRRYNRSQGSRSALFETIEIGFQSKKLCGSQSLLNASNRLEVVSVSTSSRPQADCFRKHQWSKETKPLAQGENDLINGP